MHDTPRRWLNCGLHWALALMLAACGGGGSSSPAVDTAVTPTTPATPTTPLAPPVLSMPSSGVNASTLAVIVAEGDSVSEAIGAYYQTKRGVPAANVVRVKLATGADTLSAAELATLKTEIDARLPANIQASLLTWTAPSRVVGACTMSLTSALALGFDAKYCASSCLATAASGYFDSESTRPWLDHGFRPVMMLGAKTLDAAKTLIDRGVSADATYPSGTGYLLRTSDAARSVRYPDYTALPALWASSGLQLNYINNATGSTSDTLSNTADVLFYFTGLVNVAGIGSNTYRPGAVADHLTSFGGYLPSGNGQMPITAWLDAGATASYGTVAEPCNYPQKFSTASVLIDHYYRGDTLIEAYWKSVQWPGQGLFVGEPLAQPFRDTPSLSAGASQYQISTRALRAGASYTLEYRTATSTSWVALASFVSGRAQPNTLSAPLPPGTATQLRWLGPCPTNKALQCVLSTSS